jgi:general secretion pathway protein L
VAVIDRPWLAGWLQALQGVQRTPDRLLPAMQPAAAGDPAWGHFQPVAGAAADSADDGHGVALALAGAQGVAVLGLSGALARGVQAGAGAAVRWTATPAVAAAAEAWLGAPVQLLPDAERLLAMARAAEAVASARGGDNLLQFDLAPQHRGSRAVVEGLRRLRGPRWRAARIGLAALVVVQLVGLNAYAWQTQRAMQERRAAMVALLKQTHPGVRAVLDAPLQMERETERLRAAAGRTGAADLEALMAAAAAAWPDSQGPVANLRYEPGQLALATAGWGETDVAQFRQRLQGSGYAVTSEPGRVLLRRAAGAVQ